MGLKRAGYPFKKNDLTVEEWRDLGRLEEVINEKELNQPRPVYLVEVKSS
ncbi:MAG: hypothetical protein WC374_04195 [Phycisphaerae bacterium]